MFRLIRMLTLAGAVTAVLAGFGPPASAAMSATPARTVVAHTTTVSSFAPAAKRAPAPTAGHRAPLGQPSVKADCAWPPRPGQMACLSLIRTNVPAVRGLRPASSPPSGYGPADLASAYRLPAGAGAGETVALVDAGDDPTAEADLAVYRQQYGLPPCTTANGCFSKVNQQGQQGNYPPEICDPSQGGCWPVETSLDLQMVSAACPLCKILLVEASSPDIGDLGSGVNTAVALGAKFVSNSYGGSDNPAEAQMDTQYYQHPGVVITASAGDNNFGVAYPAASQYVTAVGGTTLTKDTSSRGWTETVWSHSGNGTGSGCSQFEAKPSFQADAGCTHRTVADVSAVADPSTGVAVYDTSGAGGWLVAGGTSAAAPLIAGIYALAGTPGSGDYPNSYPYADPAALNDVTSGNNGTCSPAYLCNAGPGYDGPTGLGTPDGTAAFGVPGPHGTISGVVTDASTRNPLPGATVSADGVTVRTDASGAYNLVVAAGSYKLTVSDYGYLAQATQVSVADKQAITENFPLAVAPRATVTGTITDGSGHGWPLYATITVPGTPQPAAHTDPATGKYSIQLPQGASYTLHVAAYSPGYQAASQQLTIGASPITQNVALQADMRACVAPGYSYHYQGVPLQSFDAYSTPAGWRVVSAPGSLSWAFNDPGHAPNATGSTGNYATVAATNPDGKPADTSLITPVADLTSATAPVINFDTDFFTGNGNVDLSLNGGSTWSTVYQAVPSGVGGAHVSIPIPRAAGKPNVLVRFHFTGSIGVNNLWQVDNVYVGTRKCAADAGGLLTGRVLDANTGAGVNMAEVTSVNNPGDTTVTARTPQDPRVGSGFFVLFSHRTGRQPFRVWAGGYQGDTPAIAVAAGTTTSASFSLKAGRLVVAPTSLSPTARLGGSATATFTITNTGSVPATVSTSEQRVQAAAATVSPAPAGRAPARASAPVGGVRLSSGQLAALLGSGPAAGRPELPARTRAVGRGQGTGSAWSAVTGYPSMVAGNAVVRGAGGKIYSFGGTLYDLGVPNDYPITPQASYVYDPGTRVWSPIADMPIQVFGAAAGFVDGKIVVAGGFTKTDTTAATQIYDPATNHWTLGSSMPQPRAWGGASVFNGKLYVVGGRLCVYSTGCLGLVAASSSVFAYDPADGEWTTAADYPFTTFGLACGGFNNIDEMVCTGGNQGVSSGFPDEGYAYHAESNTWTPIAPMPLAGGLLLPDYAVANNQLVLSGGLTTTTSGAWIIINDYAYDPARDSWTSLPPTPYPTYGGGAACGFYKVGGDYGFFTSDTLILPAFGQCSDQPVSIPWLSASSTPITLRPGQSTTITVTATATGSAITQPGSYLAALSLRTSTPYPMAPVAVKFNVTPPAGWGQVSGTVTGLDCNGTATPLPGATVQVNTAAGGHTIAANASGQYSYWLSTRDNPVTVIAFNDGYLAQTKRLSITAGETTTGNFALKPAQQCG